MYNNAYNYYEKMNNHSLHNGKIKFVYVHILYNVQTYNLKGLLSSL